LTEAKRAGGGGGAGEPKGGRIDGQILDVLEFVQGRVGNLFITILNVFFIVLAGSRTHLGSCVSPKKTFFSYLK
jgi:hypothetical protein